jgi:hypothetical protein
LIFRTMVAAAGQGSMTTLIAALLAGFRDLTE